MLDADADVDLSRMPNPHTAAQTAEIDGWAAAGPDSAFGLDTDWQRVNFKLLPKAQTHESTRIANQNWLKLIDDSGFLAGGMRNGANGMGGRGGSTMQLDPSIN